MNELSLYLRRCIIESVYQALVEKGRDPFIGIAVEHPEVGPVERSFANDHGVATFNLSPSAVKYLHFDAQYITFQARFQGTVHDIVLPITAVIGLQSREGDAGFSLPLIVEQGTPTEPEPQSVPKGSHLRVVK